MLRESELFEICRLPAAFRAGAASWQELVRRNSAIINDISEEQLTTFLSGRAELIELWLAWSEDKRCSGGWFFRCSQSGYELGQLRAHRQHAPSEFFREPAPACARFILCELAG